MASEKRKLTLSKETLRTLSTTALSQVAGGTAYSTENCSNYCYTSSTCEPCYNTGMFSTCRTAIGNCNTEGYQTCQTCSW